MNEQERQLQWKALLNDLFQPLNLEISEQTNHSQIEDNGLVLYIPQVAGLAAMRLSYPQQGRRLFSEYDQQLIQNLLPFLAQAVESRVAYDNGVREERHRIARDLHDDLGQNYYRVCIRKMWIKPSRPFVRRLPKCVPSSMVC